MILLQLFWLFFRTSLVSFGGIYGALPELQRVFVVEHHFLLYLRRILGPMSLIAASGVAFALLSFGLHLT